MLYVEVYHFKQVAKRIFVLCENFRELHKDLPLGDWDSLIFPDKLLHVQDNIILKSDLHRVSHEDIEWF